MPSDIIEEWLEVETSVLIPEAPTSQSYPYPALRHKGELRSVRLESVVLENSWLRAGFVPALGGRLLQLTDKRTGFQLLHPSGAPLLPSEGGERGATLRAGVEIVLNGAPRLTAMSRVACAGSSGDEEMPAALWLAEAVTGTGLSWHLRIEMPPDRAEIELEARVFNRTNRSIPYRPGLLIPAGSSKGGFHAIGQGPLWRRSEAAEGSFLERFGPPLLAPRQLDTWRVTLRPYSGLGGFTASGPAGTLWVEDAALQIQATEELKSGKLVILLESGQSLEAPVDLTPERPFETSLPGRVAGVVVLDRDRRERLRWESGPARPLEGAEAVPARTSDLSQAQRLELEMALLSMENRHMAAALLGMDALGRRDWAEADRRFEQALLYNGEDHLCWWMKAMGRRLAGDAGEDLPELLNAHFLAPLEPCLRAESVLSQPPSGEPNPLLAAMAAQPEDLLEAASWLLECGLWDQAARFTEEALRHTDLPMLRILLAYALLHGENLAIEVADQIGRAQVASPPYPWRPIERRAIETLAGRFPESAPLREYLELLRRHGGASDSP